MSTARARRPGVAIRVWLLVAAALGVVLLANAHLVYVAFESQPDCVTHLKTASGSGSYQAAKSAC